MAKKKKDSRPARARYRGEGRSTRNKQRNVAKEERVQAFFVERNRVMQEHHLGKSLARKVVRMVYNDGLEENEAVKKLSMLKQHSNK